jgi:hypothetical protein
MTSGKWEFLALILILNLSCTEGRLNKSSQEQESRLEIQLEEYLTNLLNGEIDQVFRRNYPGADKIYLERSGFDDFEEFKQTLLASTNKSEMRRANKEMNGSVEIDSIICGAKENNSEIHIITSHIIGYKNEMKYKKKGITAAVSTDSVYFGVSGSSSLLVKRYKLTCGRTPLAGLVFSLNDT